MNTKATIQMSLLPLSVPLVERETSFSFMSRLAARNGVSTRLLGLDYDIPFKSVLDGESSVINYLNALGGVAPQQLLRWTASRSGGSYHILCDETFHGITIRNPTIKGCPVCLREDTHDPRRPPEQQIAIRGHWMVKHVFLGQKHGHPLVKFWHEQTCLTAMINHRISRTTPAPFCRVISTRRPASVLTTTSGSTTGLETD
jgi:hypothetical protein